MRDTRLNSVHLEFPRREDFRAARARLLGARGCLTIAGERFGDWLGFQAAGSAEPILPGGRSLLVATDSGIVYPLHVGLNTIGRLSNNDIVFEESVISRRHCTILVHTWGAGELHDTASRNGTYVNDRRVEWPVRLSSGDRIRICNKQFVFTSEEDFRAAEGCGDDGDTHVDF